MSVNTTRQRRNATPEQSPPPTDPAQPGGLAALGRRVGGALVVPLLAIFTALVVSGLIVWATTGDLAKAIGPQGAFAGLWQGAVGSPANIASTLLTSTPYIFAGLAVALAFKCGLFNIGVEGQLALGATASAYVGYSLTGLPAPLHIML
ncbi:MAG: hypothetical protein M3014_06870, partial [Chloroflexota bacterium]|nr:hypothetical protein [Chloroflexota bacterium]